MNRETPAINVGIDDSCCCLQPTAFDKCSPMRSMHQLAPSMCRSRRSHTYHHSVANSLSCCHDAWRPKVYSIDRITPVMYCSMNMRRSSIAMPW